MWCACTDHVLTTEKEEAEEVVSSKLVDTEITNFCADSSHISTLVCGWLTVCVCLFVCEE